MQKKLWLLILLVTCPGCLATKVAKPDPEGCTNWVGGYGFCNTMNTQKTRVLTPPQWKAMKDGEGFWFPAKELKKNIDFVHLICDATKQCQPDMIKELDQKFDLFINAPERAKKDILNEK